MAAFRVEFARENGTWYAPRVWFAAAQAAWEWAARWTAPAAFRVVAV